MRWLARSLSLIVILAPSLCAQVNLSTNLLRTIPRERPIVFEVRIEKGAIGNFTRFQLDVPDDVSVQEVDSRSGTFSFDEQKVKIIWVTSPTEEEFTVKLKLLSRRRSSKATFNFHYFYLDNGVKKEWISTDYEVVFKDTALPFLISAQMVSLSERGRPSPDVTNSGITKTSVAPKSPAEISKQVEKLRHDAAEAKLVGEREKRKAEDLLVSAEREEETWLLKPAGPDKSAGIERINRNKQKASEDLVVARRVLQLSETLDSNANEIEKLNRNLNPHVYATAEKKKEVTTREPSGIPLTGYKVQIGAFKERPSESQFRKLGKVTVIQEDLVYKVLIGEYREKADAYKLRDRLTTSYPGCFVVSFNTNTDKD